MPWHVSRDPRCPSDRPFAVIADADGSVVGCYPVEADAQRRVQDLYAAEPGAAPSTAGAEPEHACSCRTRPPVDAFRAGLAEGLSAPDIDGMTIEELAAGLVDRVRAAALATAPFDTPFPVPEYPPGDWFDGPPDWVEAWRGDHGYGPSLDPETGILHLTVTDEGRVGAYFYDRGACIIHDHSACPAPSPTRYAAFHQQGVVLEDGSTLRVGVIGNTHGHASPWVDYVQAQRHYADPSAQMIVCRAGDDERGGWIAGAIIPGLTFGDVAMLRRCALSGDWRPMPATWWVAHKVNAAAVAAADGYDCIGPTLVTRPALPLVARAASLDGVLGAILGGGGGVMLAAPSSLSAECRALAQHLAVSQHAAKIKPGPMMSLLYRAASYLDLGNQAKAAEALTQAVSVATDLEKQSPAVLKGLADQVQALLDGIHTSGAVSAGVTDPDGTLRFETEVAGMPRTTRVLPDGTIEVQEVTQEDLRHAAITAALIGATDLPIADREQAWDGQGADMRVRQLASSDGSGDVDTIDWSRYSDAFLWRDDDADPHTFGAYHLGFADVVNDRLEAVPRGVFAVAAVLQGGRGGTNIPADAQDAVRGRVTGYYTRMRDQFSDDSIQPPWQADATPTEGDAQTAAPGDAPVAPMDGMSPDGTAPDAGGDPSAPAEITVGEWNDLNSRLQAVEEFCAAVVDAQMAALRDAPGTTLPDVFAEAAASIAAAAPEFPADAVPALAE